MAHNRGAMDQGGLPNVLAHGPKARMSFGAGPSGYNPVGQSLNIRAGLMTICPIALAVAPSNDQCKKPFMNGPTHS
jgi:hypothetical protein